MTALTLKDIVKVYGSQIAEVKALKGVSINFRKSEFVSILGPSGCGKTTMLNIIGGLDRYTSGDLIINGKSTKEYTDGEWDTYRNESIGFVFQSYNLIPHQTVLSNVEMALTLSGVSKSERHKRAKAVLEKVGLKGLEHKKPNQMSGGQMQRVAIARALVNDPDIILADEPTGALDTETSIQILDLLKEVSNDRLVIMVTHNPDLARQYSTRIVTMLDGELKEDTNPLTEEELEEKTEILDTELPKEETPKKVKKIKKKKSQMKLATAFLLSLSNLKTKKGRTILTSIAGSIGIIGIALVLAVSTGFSTYIHKLQADTLSVYPVTISEAVIDLSDFEKLSEKAELEKYPKVQEIYTAKMFDSLANMLKSNKLTDDYIEYLDTFVEEKNEDAASTDKKWQYCVQKGYGFDVNNYVYSNIGMSMVPGADVTHAVMPIDSLVRSLENMFNQNMSQTGTGISAEFVRSYIPTMTEMPNNRNLLESQYEIIDEGGRWAENANEIMIVVDKTNSITDLTLALLGYRNLVVKDVSDAKVEFEGEDTFTFEQVKEKKFYYIDNDTRYKLISGKDYIEFAYDENDMPEDALELTITGILRMKEGVTDGVLGTGIAYTEKLVERILLDNKNSQIGAYFNKDENKNDVSIYSCMQEIETVRQSIADGAGVDKNLVSDEQVYNVIKTQLPPVVNTKRDVAADDTVNKISIFSYDFEAKEAIKAYLDEWNTPYKEITDNPNSTPEEIEEAKKNLVYYSDSTAMLFSALNSVVDSVKYVLIAFTAISLVVSSIMIGIITYVSVVERTKEIGILRSIGARKKDVSRIFNAETFIIGLFAGLLGVIITYILTIPINLILGMLIPNVGNLAALPITDALILIIVSFTLTVIAGLIPARIAAKKDPVIALRTE